MILHACEYQKLNSNCPIISINELSDTCFNIHIPKSVAGYRLYDILEISCTPNRTVAFEDVSFDSVHPWVDIPIKNLNREYGKHIYKISFMDKYLKNFINVYAAYVIQDDNVHRDYIYMLDRYNPKNEDRYGEYVYM